MKCQKIHNIEVASSSYKKLRKSVHRKEKIKPLKAEKQLLATQRWILLQTRAKCWRRMWAQRSWEKRRNLSKNV